MNYIKRNVYVIIRHTDAGDFNNSGKAKQAIRKR